MWLLISAVSKTPFGVLSHGCSWLWRDLTRSSALFGRWRGWANEWSFHEELSSSVCKVSTFSVVFFFLFIFLSHIQAALFTLKQLLYIHNYYINRRPKPGLALECVCYWLFLIPKTSAYVETLQKKENPSFFAVKSRLWWMEIDFVICLISLWMSFIEACTDVVCLSGEPHSDAKCV